MPAILLGDVSDNFVSTPLIEVHVDVRHLFALGIQEPLEDQPVLEGVQIRDPQRVADDRSRRRSSSWSDPDPMIPGVPDEIPHDEEVPRKPHPLDHGELVLDPRSHIVRVVAISLSGSRVDQFPKVAVQRLAGRRVEPRQVQVTEPEIELARLGDGQGGVAGLGQAVEDLPHLLW